MEHAEPTRRRYPIASHVGLVMTILSATYWFISFPSWLPIPLPNDFPNTIAAKWQSGRYSAGALSHHRLSCLFLSRVYPQQDSPSRWSERSDGHFCSFDIPPTEWPHEPPGFTLSLNPQTIGWNLPYWVMLALWASVYLKTRPAKFSLRDLFLVVTVFAVVLAATFARFGLLIVVPMNLLTVALVLFLVIQAARLIWRHYPSGNTHAETRG